MQRLAKEAEIPVGEFEGEAGLAEQCDLVVFVDATSETRRDRRARLRARPKGGDKTMIRWGFAVIIALWALASAAQDDGRLAHERFVQVSGVLLLDGLPRDRAHRRDLFDEVAAAVRKSNGWVDGIVVSGGEPTLRDDLPGIVALGRPLIGDAVI